VRNHGQFSATSANVLRYTPSTPPRLIFRNPLRAVVSVSYGNRAGATGDATMGAGLAGIDGLWFASIGCAEAVSAGRRHRVDGGGTPIWQQAAKGAVIRPVEVPSGCWLSFAS
jgi:hypothetical protein